MGSHLEDQLLMMKKFPLLVPQNSTSTVYDGFLSVEKRYFHISLVVPKYPLLDGMNLHCSWELAYFLKDKEKEVQELADTCSMLSFYLTSLQNLLTSCMKTQWLPPSQLNCTNMESFQRLMSDIETVGMKHIEFLSHSMTWLKLRVIDDAQRCHILRLDVGANYPHENIQVQADLPQIALQNIKKNNSVVGIFRSFVHEISSLQNIWKLLDNVDEECWVLDPDKPTRKDMTRRIVIGQNLSLQLTFDSNDAMARPSMKLFGPELGVQPFRESLAANVEEWQDTCSLVENLKCVLSVATFPVRPDSLSQKKDQLVYEGECVICYSVQLEGELPSEVCKNVRCGSPFHASCLLENATRVYKKQEKSARTPSTRKTILPPL
ncbi:E3 ubiquitin-protein ligase FANCL isoform X2 [Anabrus simplex]|uniref:E3 ubiquitin-protein ligase FANCL isoform X2 n=1 Tax=Anabrus simplex TaxID=316456 RepID=UPI0035A27226